MNVTPTAPGAFAQVIRTEQLKSRFTREPDFEAENRALVELAQTLAANPSQILNRLVNLVLELCQAGSSGISILDSETGGNPEQFRWHALAGPWSSKYLGSVLPRDFSPCGVVLSRNNVELMANPSQYYHYIAAIDPPCHEVLLAPFSRDGRPVGTIWAVMHAEHRHFDAEDARVLASVAKFASAGYQALKANEALEAYGKERAREAEALAEANKSKDEFIATIAHELRNPMGPIRNTSTLLLRGSSDPALVKRAAEIIERQSSVVVRLINDLLDISRMRRGSLELHRSRVNLADVLRAALESSLLFTQGCTHQLKIDLAEEPIYVEGDAIRLTQVLGNLLDNAAKYTDADGQVSVRLALEGTHAVIAISDSGIGISANEIDSIFEMFAQAGQTGRSRSHGGLGIGLHLARKLVEAHNGVLTAASPGPGKGSTFSVKLPGL